MTNPVEETGHQSGLKTAPDRVRETFIKLGYPQLNGISCTADGNGVLLTGVLESFYLKQVAQSVAVKIAQGCEVRNEIQVR